MWLLELWKNSKSLPKITGHQNHFSTKNVSIATKPSCIRRNLHFRTQQSTSEMICLAKRNKACCRRQSCRFVRCVLFIEITTSLFFQVYCQMFNCKVTLPYRKEIGALNLLVAAYRATHLIQCTSPFAFATLKTVVLLSLFTHSFAWNVV